MKTRGSCTILLFLGTTLNIEGFVQHAPQRSPRALQRVPSVKFAGTSGHSAINDASNEMGFLNELPEVMDDARKSIASSDGMKEERLPWIAMLTLLLYTKVSGAAPTLPAGLSGKNVAFSAVSASLLRQSSKKSRAFNKWIVGGALVAFQLNNILVGLSTGLPRFCAWYMTCLDKLPIVTKAITAGIIGSFGDIVAQSYEERIRAKDEGIPFDIKNNYDRRRGLSIVLDGVFLQGPLLHFAYNFLESMFPVVGSGLMGSLSALTQVLIDDFVVDGVFVGTLFFTTGLGEGYSLRQIFPQFKKDYFSALKASWATSIMLMPLEFALFRFFPLSLRVLGINFIDLIWAAMVSLMVHRRRRAASQETACA